jgi:hypothetical protein
MAAQVHPANERWLYKLQQLMTVFVVKEPSTALRIQALLILEKKLWEFRFLFLDELITHALLPYVPFIVGRAEVMVREALLRLCAQVAGSTSVSPANFRHMLAILHNATANDVLVVSSGESIMRVVFYAPPILFLLCRADECHHTTHASFLRTALHLIGSAAQMETSHSALYSSSFLTLCISPFFTVCLYSANGSAGGASTATRPLTRTPARRASRTDTLARTRARARARTRARACAAEPGEG